MGKYNTERKWPFNAKNTLYDISINSAHGAPIFPDKPTQNKYVFTRQGRKVNFKWRRKFGEVANKKTKFKT